jgi:YidC/Oxa1 family membrane protein insertase
LKQFGYGFENTVEMGPKFLLWISRIFLWLLTQLYSLIPVWGWTLIAFSVILKALLYPVTHKSFESTSKMQKIQPQVKEIQAKYKNDPQTMNAEMQKVYKEHGVSPFGGCLWMLIQMPILFALYPLLRYNINLRQSEFMWLPDLSEPDPLFILPIVMAIFMFVQQRLAMPSKEKLEKMDEKQQAAMQSQKMMMYIMPVMMFFIFRSLSSGLVLYWTVFNIISVVQQRIINKKLK